MSKDHRPFIPSIFNPNRGVELRNPERLTRAEAYIAEKAERERLRELKEGNKAGKNVR